MPLTCRQVEICAERQLPELTHLRTLDSLRTRLTRHCGLDQEFTFNLGPPRWITARDVGLQLLCDTQNQHVQFL